MPTGTTIEVATWFRLPAGSALSTSGTLSLGGVVTINTVANARPPMPQFAPGPRRASPLVRMCLWIALHTATGMILALGLPPLASAVEVTPNGHLQIFSSRFNTPGNCLTLSQNFAQATCTTNPCILSRTVQHGDVTTTGTLVTELADLRYRAEFTSRHTMLPYGCVQTSLAFAACSLTIVVPEQRNVSLSIAATFGSGQLSSTSSLTVLLRNLDANTTTTLCSLTPGTQCDPGATLTSGRYRVIAFITHHIRLTNVTLDFQTASSLEVTFEEQCAGAPPAAGAITADWILLMAPSTCDENLDLIGGDNFTIRWRSGSPRDVRLVLRPSAGAPTSTIAVVLGSATVGEYIWSIPTDVISKDASIIIEDFADPPAAPPSTSAPFRIRQYALARPQGAGFERFSPDRHGWSFENAECGNGFDSWCDGTFHCPPGEDCFCTPEQQLGFWPQSWYSRPEFDYFTEAGRDPFTMQPYNQGESPFLFTLSIPPERAFPDWPSFVRAFGTDDAYGGPSPLNTDGYREAFVQKWFDAHKRRGFSGVCHGMAMSALADFLFPGTYVPAGTELFDQHMTSDVRIAITRLQVYTHGRRRYEHAVARATRTVRETLEDLKRQLLSDAYDTYSVLYINECGFRNLAGACVDEAGEVEENPGGHSLVPYRLERLDFTPGTGRWRVSVYDPNMPGSTTQYVDIDSVGGGGDRGYYRYDHNNSLCVWSGIGDLYLDDPVANYLVDAESREETALRPIAAGDRATGTILGSMLYVAATRGADVRLTAADGRAVGFEGSTLFRTLESAVPDIPVVGRKTTPIGYIVPRSAYGITLGAFPDAAASASIYDAGRIYAYSREDARSSETDRLAYAGASGLRVRNDDAGVTKAIVLRAIADDVTQERSFDLRELALAGGDSVAVAIVDDSTGHRLRLANSAGPQSYRLRIREVSDQGGTHFLHVGVPLAAGATHIIRPNWATLVGGVVEVDVDMDGDGTPETTLVLTDHTTETPLSLMSASAEPGRIRLTWFCPEPGLRATVYRTEAGSWTALGEVSADGSGYIAYEDTRVTAGARYGYRLGVVRDGTESFLGETWLEVPRTVELALAGARPNPTSENLTVAFTLVDASPARLELFDLAGRMLLTRDVGAFGSGSHVVRLMEGRSAAPGVYMLRLTAKGRALVSRVVIVR